MSSATENQAQMMAHAEENGDGVVDAKSRKVDNDKGKYESAFNMITTPEIICDLFSFLDKDQIERIQLVNRFWNNIIIRHKNILPLRQFLYLYFYRNEICLVATKEDWNKNLNSYRIKLDGTNLRKGKRNVSSRYSQRTVDEVLTNLNDVVFDNIQILYIDYPYSKYSDFSNSDNLDDIFDSYLFLLKLVATKTGSRFRGRSGYWDRRRFDLKLNEIFDNYIIVDELNLRNYYGDDSHIREVCANPEIVKLPSTPKEIRLGCLEFKENEEVLNFTCNGKLNGANRLTIDFETSKTNYGNFIRQWFELYPTHENPISLVGKFELIFFHRDSVLDAVKTFLNNNQLCVKYSLEEFHRSARGDTYHYLKRSCVLHETYSYALVIEMAYRDVTDISSINASDLDQPPCNQMAKISFCVKSL